MTIQIKKYYCSLSEAMRAGATLRPQCAGQLFSRTRSCAIGAAIEAVTGVSEEPSDSDFGEFQSLYAATFAMRPPCPAEPCYGGNLAFDDLGFVVTHLNDYHSWPREKIADWVETQESEIGFVTLLETETSPEMSLGITNEESQVSVSALTK